MAEWELSKENIQPLRQGRKVSAMLDPASDAKKISEEKQWEFSKSVYANGYPYYMLPNANTIYVLHNRFIACKSAFKIDGLSHFR